MEPIDVPASAPVAPPPQQQPAANAASDKQPQQPQPPLDLETVFAEYSFVAPSILFAENNVISEEMFRPNPDKKPSTSNLVGCIFQVLFSLRS